MFIVPFIMKVNVHQQQNGNKILFTTKILLLQCEWIGHKLWEQMILDLNSNSAIYHVRLNM